MKYLNILLIFPILLSNPVLAKFVGVPIRNQPPVTEEADEPELATQPELSDYGLQAGIDNNDDLRLLAQLYRNAARRSDGQAFKLKALISQSNLDYFSKASLRAALLLGKLDNSSRELDESDIKEIEKVSSRVDILSQDTIRSLLRSLRSAQKQVASNLIDDIKNIRIRLRAHLAKD